MKLPPFLLDHWLSRFEHAGLPHDLATSTGARWTVGDLLAMLGSEERAALERQPLTYAPAAGSRELRDAIAALLGVEADHVLVTHGASEALHAILAGAEAGAEVIVPAPCYPPLLEIPRALGLTVRSYELRAADGFAPDLDEVAALIGGRTALLVVNSPHNPTGAVIARPALQALAALAHDRGVPLVADEVYWPLAFDGVAPSAAALPGVILVGSLSKAISLSGLRLGWIVDPDAARRARHLNTRMYFTISNGPLVEALAAAAVRRAETFLARTREQAVAGRGHLLAFLARNGELVEAVPPAGGTVAFPALTFAADSRPFCEALAAEGVVVAPGDCFGMPRHFRLGFAADPQIEAALAITERVLRRCAAAAPQAARVAS
jgi:aspartate/methionine/tyrosine aminotransferase